MVQPRVAIRDGFGRLLTGFAHPVTVRSNIGAVRGDSVIPFREGVAQFSDLSVVAGRDFDNLSNQLTLNFTSAWWVRSLTTSPLGRLMFIPDRFRLVRVIIDDDTLVDPTRWTAHGTGDSLRVTVTFEFTTREATSNYVVAAAPTWVPAAEGVVRLAGLPRPVVNAWQTVGFTLPRPRRPGRFAVVFSMSAEGSAEHVMSRTNWAAGAPVWGDGNDLIQLSEAELEQLRTTNRVRAHPMLIGGYPVRLGGLSIGGKIAERRGPAALRYDTTEVWGAVILVEVPPQPQRAGS